MKYILSFCTIIAVAVLSIAIANAQTESPATRHYDKNGLVFDYPDDWKLSEDSSRVPTVTLTRAGSLAQIVIRTQANFDGSPPAPVGVTTIIDHAPPLNEGSDSCNFESERKKIADGLTEQLAKKIHAKATQRIPVTTSVGKTDVKGVQLQGVLNRKPVTGSVHTFRLNRQFVSLVYIFVAGDEKAKSAWNTIVDTLTIGPKALTALGPSIVANSGTPIEGEVLNGRAVSLAHPEYPRLARSARATGTVTVQVIIDESGNVIIAHAVAGHPLLQGVSVAAARKSKFLPTKLCGEPVKVTGVITYNFVAQ